MEEIRGQICPVCGKKELILREDVLEIPYFGNVFLFSMNCVSCGFSKSDLEAEEQKAPVKATFEIENEKDLNVRVVKSSHAFVKIPQLRMTMEPGEAAEGFVTNLEGLLNKFEKILEQQRDNSDEDDIRKKAKNLLKKIWKVKCGDIPLKVIIEDKTGNSAIISEKTKIEKIK